MRKSPNFLRLFAFLFTIFMTGNALATGYTCPAYKDYTSCAEGYYLCNGSNDACAGDGINETATDNRCCVCQDYELYTGIQSAYCPGETTCPARVYQIELRNYNNTASSGTGTLHEIYGYRWTNSSYTTLTSVTVPTRSGYTFNGYYDATSGGTLKIPATGILPSPTAISASADLVYLYERWTLTAVTCSAGTYLPGNSLTCAACTAGNYCAGGTFNLSSSNQGLTACTTLGSNYTSSANATAATSCYIPSSILTVDKYIATQNGNTISTCAAGTYKAAHSYYYGSVAETCSSCSNKPSAASYTGTGGGVNSCPWTLTCSAGNYFLYNATETSRSCAACTVGNYCTGTTATQATASSTGLTACTTLGSNYTLASGTQSAATSCYIPATTLTADKYIATQNSNTISTCPTGTYFWAHTYYYGSPAESCSSCSNKPSAATYTSTGGGTNACPWSLTCSAGNYFLYNATETSRACSSCTATNYCTGVTATQATAASAGLSACPTNYVNGGTGLSAQNQCKWQTTAGYFIPTANSTTATTCTRGFYCPSALISYGSTGSIIECSDGTYSDDGASSCTSCAIGSFSQSGSDSCAPCQNGTTTTSIGSASCDTSCSNSSSYVSSWLSAIWQTNNTVTNLCSINACSVGYSLTGGQCIANTYVITLRNYNDTASSGTGTVKEIYNTNWTNSGGTTITNVTIPTRIGYTFAGYYDATSGGTLKIPSNGVLPSKTTFTSDDILYERWTTGTNSVTYNLNGGSGATPSSTSCSSDISCSLNDGATATFYRAGYVLVGWSTNSSATTGSFTITVNSPTTVYAVWSICTGSTYKTPSDQASASCTSCLTNYTISGFLATDHDSAADCKISCNAGTYIANANDTTCTDVGNGYWVTATSGISQGTVSDRQECPTVGSYGQSSAPRDNINTCYTVCNPGTYVKTPGDGCQTLSTNDLYIIENYVYYNEISEVSTCDTANGYHIIGKVLYSDHDSITDCTATCSPGYAVFNANEACAICSDGNYCPGATISYGSVGSFYGCPSGYVDGGTGLSSQSQCSIDCSAGNYIASANSATCSVLTTDNMYIEDNSVTYGDVSEPITCDTANGYHIIGKTLGSEHDSINDCYQTCAMQSIAPPTGAVKTPANTDEYYPHYCVYIASCPLGYSPTESGNFYDDSGYTTDPYCEAMSMDITFDANGGTIIGGGTTYQKACSVGSSCVLSDTTLSQFQKTGYVFGGWAKTSSGLAVYQNNSDLNGLEISDVTLFAVWGQCAAGYSWDGSNCSACPIGTWKSGLSAASGSAVACTSCAAGSTTSGTASTSVTACTSCPAGSFCSSDGNIVTSCSTLGDGSWTLSAAGAQASSQCYKNCPSYSVTYGTAMTDTGNAFYPNDCQYYCISDTGNRGEVQAGKCVEKSCKNTFEMVGGVCQSCNRENAISYKTTGNCEVDSCASGYHPNGQSCEENVVNCDAPNADDAQKTWNASKASFSTCKITTCSYGYHLSSNACVADEQTCAIENGLGTKTWDGSKNAWGICKVTSCNPGYTSEYSETNEHTKQCGACKNKYSILGEVAVSSYSRECEIASCMYQGELYNLENNECVPICDVAGYEDETGKMKWNPSTKKCERQCKDGYTSWPSYSLPSTKIPDISIS